MPAATPFRRIAVARPPAHWFHGIDRTLFDIYRQVLVDLGLEIFEVPTDAFYPPDPPRILALANNLRAFGPELAIGLPHGHYALICRLPAGAGGDRPNFFLHLDIPTLCRWDHSPVDLAERVLDGAPEDGALETLRRTLAHPRLIHWSRDTGQSDLMRSLGLLSTRPVIQEPSPSLPGFDPGGGPTVESAAFIGHFYREAPPRADADGLVRQWLASPGQPLWSLLEPDLDRAAFWRFANRLIRYYAQTPRRFAMLGAARVPVTCYGDLPVDLPEVPANLVGVPAQIPFGPELAAALSLHAITVDVMNPAFLNGYSHKPVLGFASGGFLLVDWKQDFVDAFGDAGEAVSYRDGQELAVKIDRFLADPKGRREAGDAIRQRISARFRARDVFARVLQSAYDGL